MTARAVRLRRPSRALIGWIITLAAAAAGEVWLHLQTTELGYELAVIRRVSLRLAAERSELVAELAAMTSPQALDRAARERFGLHPPREGQVVGMP